MKLKPYRSNAEKQLRLKRSEAKRKKHRDAMNEARRKRLLDPKTIEENRQKDLRHWEHVKQRALNTVAVCETKLSQLKSQAHLSVEGAE